MVGRMGIVGDAVNGVRDRFRSGVDGVKETIDDVFDRDPLTAGVNRVKGFFQKNASLRRKIGRGL